MYRYKYIFIKKQLLGTRVYTLHQVTYYDNHDKGELKTVTRRRRGKKYISETVFRRLNMR